MLLRQLQEAVNHHLLPSRNINSLLTTAIVALLCCEACIQCALVSIYISCLQQIFLDGLRMHGDIDNVWEVKDNMFNSVRCLSSPAPMVVIELTKYGCKSYCHGTRCSCFNVQPCTPVQNATLGVYDKQTRYVGYIVACIIVNDIQPFRNFKIVNSLISKYKSLNSNLNLIG